MTPVRDRLLTLRRLARRGLKRLRRIGASRALILTYHRVGTPGVDPWSLSVTPDHFAAQLSVLSRLAHPLSLSEFVARRTRGELPERPVVVTFDDGYANNLYEAKPLLGRAGIKATVFVVTSALTSGREYWWDELEQPLLLTDRLPERLELKLQGKPWTHDLGPAASYPPAVRRADAGRRAWQAAPGTRLALYHELWQRLQALSGLERQALIDALCDWAGVERCLRDSHRSLTLDELSELGAGGSFQVGAHTLSHTPLAPLPKEAQRQEIEGSRAFLSEQLGRDIHHFSYPFGSYDETTVALVRGAGFDCACSSGKEAVWRGSSLFVLPRMTVHNDGPEPFAAKLEAWFRS